MKFMQKDAGLFTAEDGRAVCRVKEPFAELDGRDVPAAEAGLTASQSARDCGDGLFLFENTVKNTSAEAKTFKLIFELITAYTPTHWVIPCVSYNGNEWGEGKEPKGMLAENGEPWIHSYDRTPIPSCSVTETETVAAALFASGDSPESIKSSVSVRPAENGTVSQRIYWPVTEAPFTYCDNDKYTDRCDDYLTLAPGESFTSRCYLLLSEPKWKNYGITAVLDRALELFPFTHGVTRPTKELWRLGISYTQTLLREFRGKRLFCSGTMPRSTGLAFSPHYEVGWCGQNIMNARMLVLEYLRTGNKNLLDAALDVCDAWLEKQSDNGLLLAHYEWYTEGRNWNYKPRDYSKSWASNVDYNNGWLPETCNNGWAACEMLKLWDLLRKNGIERPDYLAFARRTLDFFCDHYSEQYAFGKAWDFDGTCAEAEGTVGAFITMALCDGYRITGDERYLTYAVKSLDFYMKRDLDEFTCTAGAIDCTCVDKETAGPVIIAALDLYEITGQKRFLEYAEKASYYFASWMFVYDIPFRPESDIAHYGYYSAGSTSVSVQHPALDQWGELMCCEWLRLADYTGDKRWADRARMSWYNCTQCIADEENNVYHGMKRPVGSQNEAFYHARWGHRADCVTNPGYLNDWLVSWVNVFRLTVLDRLTSVNHYPDWSKLD